jgi:uncharacterized protein
MLVNFTVSNFRSFKESQTLSMEATAIRELNEYVIPKDKYRLLPSAVIYGANSSGKSNLLKALLVMQKVVLESVKLNPDDLIVGYEPFVLSEESISEPTSFEIQFLIDSVKYRYGFDFDASSIKAEWLYEKKGGEREYNLFLRADTEIQYSKKRFLEGLKIKNLSVEKNRLLLSLAAQLSEPVSQGIMKWFKMCNVISGIEGTGYENFTIKMLKEHIVGYDEAVSFLRNMKLGFDNIEIEESDFNQGALSDKMPQEMKDQLTKTLSGKKILSVNTVHKIYDKENKVVGTKSFNKDRMESEGSKKLIEMSGPIFDTLLNNKVLIVDELDAKLHPVLTRELVKVFNSQSRGAQLIFATHDTNLLNINLFRRDQIWLTEKNEAEATELYSLVEFKESEGKKVRKDSSLEKDYMKGRYGAIPYI